MGNCFDRTLSDSDAEDEQPIQENEEQPQHQLPSSSNSSHHRHRTSSRNNNYIRIDSQSTGSSHSSLLTNSNGSLSSSSNRPINNSNHIYIQNHHHVNNAFNSSSLPVSSSNGGGTVLSSSFQSVPHQVFYLSPSVNKTAEQLTEEEQIKLLKRMALIQQLPSGSYDEGKKNKECVICMIDFEINDTIKYLPCLHTFHQSCIDSWLVRSLICPSCMEPVDAGLLSAYEN